MYFGKILFAYTLYSPYAADGSTMMWKIGLPSIDSFWQTINLDEYLTKHLIWALRNIYEAHLIVFPTFVYPLSFILIPTILLATWKLKFNGIVLLTFAILYFLGLLQATEDFLK